MYRRARAYNVCPAVGPQRYGWMRVAGVVAFVVLAAGSSGCQSETAQQPVELVVVDSLLAELGGTLTASLDRGQRWRMISSLGPGLPPNDFRAEDLPEPGSRGAGLLQVYCVQCHWLPTPQMHSAAEWPVLVKRNLLRMQQLKDRLGGPLTTGLVGEVVMAGFVSAEIPAPADVDTLIAYLRRYALPTATPGELTEGPGRDLFMQRCSVCHELPSPAAHTATGWERLVGEMQAIMAISNVTPLETRELDLIKRYLRERAAR